MNIYDENILVTNNLRIRDFSMVNVYDNQNRDEKEGQILVAGTLFNFKESTPDWFKYFSPF